MTESKAAFATDEYGSRGSDDWTAGVELRDTRWPGDISGLVDALNRGGRGTQTPASAGPALSDASESQAQDTGFFHSLADRFQPLRPELARRPTLHPLQEWEGYVVGIGEGDFTSRLTDLTAGHSYETEEAVIPLDEISDHDHVKLREGSIFRWVIGYERSPSGTKRRVSQIIFRDLPAMTESDFRSGAEWARGITRSFRE